MATIYVQFTDSAETDVSSVFPCPQDEDLYPNQGEMETSDARYKAFFESLPAVSQTYIPRPGK
ncbi:MULTISPECIES: hypothetical protein [Burkholderia]|uniref:hypothetical protein n=1 Tax=Burkholderia TaxID=32008 RepID=UPI000DC502AF|nr:MULTISPECIES: hypothetical protein [Burkholderia]MDP9544172.1 hypothetical protein [Burkholderia cepacia]MBR8394372.1 hypothetical protein [Burkholderia cenocepacia]MBR8471893.1 hypothetical protein [Burkholderia cenocepacia]MBR8487715.1 hypothetical protein [Burkholderia cenocepacia]MDO5917471.1 hypothetical protein [Burkholderia cenocepacia]